MWLGGTAAGTVVRLRHDVDDEVAAVLHGRRINRELTYVVDDVATAPGAVAVVMSGTRDGDELVARLRSDGFPPGLAGIGFKGTGDLWEPWCAALEADAIVSVAFAARLSPDGAEIGVATAPHARGRGLATAVAAAWSGHPELAGRARFYPTAEENRPSCRVAERLGLGLLGSTISIR
jgi:RimJ/RimL family protein N-acetyltransferase